MISLPMQSILAIDVASAIPAIAPLLFITIPQPVRKPALTETGGNLSMWATLHEELLFIVRWKPLLVLRVISVFIYMLSRAAGSLSPLIVLDHLRDGAPEQGAWQDAAGIGTVIGGIILSVRGGVRRRILPAPVLP